MSREEALNDWLPIIRQKVKGTEVYVEALEMAIKALQQEPCGDCISRQGVLDALDKSKYSKVFCEEHHIDWSINLGMAHIVVNELKPVTPQPKMGQWIFDEVLDHHYYCSECKAMGVDYWDYCPYCGSYNGGDAE